MKVIWNTNGGNVEDDYPTDKPLSQLKLDVMKAANLDLEQADQYQVASDGAFLDHFFDRLLLEPAIDDRPRMRNGDNPAGHKAGHREFIGRDFG